MRPTKPEHPDDNLMDRFDEAGARRYRARDSVIAIALCAAILILAAGQSIRKAGNAMSGGIGRDAVLAVGTPSAWLANHLPVQHAAHDLTAWLSPNLNLNSYVGFNTTTTATALGQSIPAVTADAFDPATIGAPPPPKRPLHTLLVTGDSMSEPLDHDLAQTLAVTGIKVIQDPHIGTGISSTILLDWGKLSAYQVRHNHPDAIVVFIGANDGYSMPAPGGRQINCCTAQWAALYAQRAREMMNTYRQNGNARVYWLTLPTPRDPARAKISLVVNAAIQVAAEPWKNQIRILDTVPTFTPTNHYQDAITINGQPTIVRQSDGIHLNDAGSTLAAKLVLKLINQDFTTH